MSVAWRGLAAFVLVTCGGLLWLGGAGSLQAAQRLEGLATGAPPAPYVCAFRARTGQPCLGCGGTTAFEAAARGRFREAAVANPLGAFTGLAAWLLAFAAGVTAGGGGSGWLRRALLAVLALLPAAFVVNAVVWWMSLPPGAWH